MLRLAAARIHRRRSVVLGAGAGSAAARGLELSPFAGDHRRAAARRAFRLIRSGSPTPTPTPTPTGRPERTGRPSAAAPPPAAAPAPAKPAAAAPAAKSCSRDEECPAENICQGGTCQAIQRRTNVLYLYYREGSFREILGLFWSKSETRQRRIPCAWCRSTGTSGRRRIARAWWRRSSGASRTSPRAERSTVIVPGLPISWSSQPDASSFGVWPIFYRSTKFGWAAPLLGRSPSPTPITSTGWGSLLFLYWWKRSPDHSVDLAFPLLFSTRTPASAFTYAVPLNFYWREKDDKNLLALPFLYGNQHKNGGSLYALTGYRTHEKGVDDGSLFWLYWFGTDDTDKSAYDVLFPLLWSFRSPKSSTTVALPFLYAAARGLALRHRRPAVVQRRRPATRAASSAPCCRSSTGRATEHDKKELLLLPIGGYSRDDVAGLAHAAALPLPLHAARSRRDASRADAHLRCASPGPPRRRHHPAHQPPALPARRSDRGRRPSCFRSSGTSATPPTAPTATAAPALLRAQVGSTDQSTFAGVFPLWFYQRSFTDGGWSAGLFPLAFFGQRGEAGHARGLPAGLALPRGREEHHRRAAALLRQRRPARLRQRDLAVA